MIAKIIKGSDFAGLINYLTMRGRGEILDTHFLSSSEPAEIAEEMSLTASLSSRCKKPVAHIAISYAREEAPSVADMRADAQAALDSLGMTQHAAVVIRHRDNGLDHFHIGACRVGFDGKAAHDSQSYARLEQALRRIEVQRGWTPVPGRHAPTPEGHRKNGAAKMNDPHQFTAAETVREALFSSTSERDLRQRLNKLSWEIEVIRRPGKQPGLLLIGPEGHRIAASKIDRAASFGNLQKRWKTVKEAGADWVEQEKEAQSIALPQPQMPDAITTPPTPAPATTETSAQTSPHEARAEPPTPSSPPRVIRNAIHRLARAFSLSFRQVQPATPPSKPRVVPSPKPKPRAIRAPSTPRLH